MVPSRICVALTSCSGIRYKTMLLKTGKTMFEYQVPEADREHTLPTKRTWLPRGTFALQGHPPMPGI